jgi:hypothetical protein
VHVVHGARLAAAKSEAPSLSAAHVPCCHRSAPAALPRQASMHRAAPEDTYAAGSGGIQRLLTAEAAAMQLVTEARKV